MIKIGMMIGERYEILEKIGTGGMSDVYKAKDHKLNRFVAMKVLKQEFSENTNFVSKFRIEAQAAAGLAHPNIVNVYDVGEESGIYYIVMELVEGITLKKYIEKKARLSYKEAVSIAIQVSMGIEAAHNNHIIHRDIKPQNIIISKDGKVKVTDFGIAKAATSNTITSNVMGSVHYTSPEQARGGYSDEKSDIYSLGITMFEMLTGRVPFNGETTVAIAIKHIQEEMPSPAEFVTEIPSSVESIVLKCCQKSPDRRYQNVQELVADLKQSLMNPDEDFVVQNDPDMEGGTRMIPEGDVAQIKRYTSYQEYEEPETMRLRSEVEEYYEDTEDEEDEEDGDDYDYNYNPGMERMTTILAILGGIVICVIVIILAVNLLGLGKDDTRGQGGIVAADSPEPTGDGSEVECVPMPDVVGKTVEDAKNTLAAMGFRSQAVYEESDVYDVGVVIRADVESGTEIPVGSLVTLTASVGPHGIEIPPVVDHTFEEAKQILENLGFVVERMEAYSETVAAGIVVSQSPVASEKAPSGASITLTVSLGSQTVKMPYLIGMSEADGIITLKERGLDVEVVHYEYNSQYAAEIIFNQSYTRDVEVAPGTAVVIWVSKGPEPTAEPVTYKCNISIEAPTKAEDPDYRSSMPVNIKLVTDDGRTLWETTATSFPQTVNYYNLNVSGGTITMTYTVEIPGTPTTDPDTSETIIPPATTETRTITRRVEFEKE
ncbi:MAG: Stk1 family PASTA domain-containing Ser/Thr kinase [Acetatifactor sp.]|nr:Stk1 family PASTA domain-containing Ser/Thr kinase [Acetatifactor sp.]